MKTTVRKKTFDCVEMMHRAQQRICQELEGKTLEEKLAYWNQSPEPSRAQSDPGIPGPPKRTARPA